MGLGSFLKKVSPVAIDKKIAEAVIKPIADKTGDKLTSSIAGTVAANDTSSIVARNEKAEHKVGGTFRDIDRAGGNFTPLQVDNAVARKWYGLTGDAGGGFVAATTTRGPKDGSDDRYFDSDRNVSIAAASVGAGFIAAGSGAGAGASDGLYAVNSFDSGAMASSLGYTSPGWAGSGGSAALFAENAFDSGAMWEATASETPWYSGLGSALMEQGGETLLKLAGGTSAPTTAYGAGAGFGEVIADDTAAPGETTDKTLIILGVIALFTLAGLAAVAKKKGRIHG